MARTIRKSTLGLPGAAPGAATAIVSGGVTSTLLASRYRIAISTTVSSVLNFTATPAGGSKVTMALNNGVALQASTLYEFNIPVTSQTSDATPKVVTYNLEVATNGTIHFLVWDEVEE